MAYSCSECGSVKFNLLMSGNVECANCGETEHFAWQLLPDIKTERVKGTL